MNHLVNNIEEETGINPGWINNGGLFIANNKVIKITDLNNFTMNNLAYIVSIRSRCMKLKFWPIAGALK